MSKLNTISQLIEGILTPVFRTMTMWPTFEMELFAKTVKGTLMEILKSAHKIVFI